MNSRDYSIDYREKNEGIQNWRPFVSIIIPTLNRITYLLNTLESLLNQDYPYYEIIIIDSSDQSANSSFNNLTNQHKIRYYLSDRIGTSAAKNEGIKQAKGEIIIFCDDDVVAQQNFISMHVGNYYDISVGGVGGRVITKKGTCPELGEKVGKIRFDVSMIANFNAVSKVEIDHVYGCNMSFRKDILVRTGGFDINFSGNSYFEETDLSMRVRKMGYKLIFEPEAIIFHVQPDEGGCRVNNFNKWMYWYYHNYAILLKKHYKKSRLPVFFIRQIIWICVWTIVKKDINIPNIAFGAFKKGWDEYPTSVI